MDSRVFISYEVDVQQMYIRAQFLVTSFMFGFISYEVPKFYICITYSTL